MNARYKHFGCACAECIAHPTQQYRVCYGFRGSVQFLSFWLHNLPSARKSRFSHFSSSLSSLWGSLFWPIASLYFLLALHLSITETVTKIALIRTYHMDQYYLLDHTFTFTHHASLILLLLHFLLLLALPLSSTPSRYLILAAREYFAHCQELPMQLLQSIDSSC